MGLIAGAFAKLVVPGEGPGGRRCPDVRLIDHQTPDAHAAPAGVVPLKRRGIHHLGRTMHAVGLAARVRVGNGTAVVDRMALAILENFQGEVPDVLRPLGAPDRVAS